MLGTPPAASALGSGIVLGPELAIPPDVPEGEVLISELNCVACHAAGEDLRKVARKSPVLGPAGMQVTPQYLRRFLADPAGYKPGSTMPDLLHHLNGAEKPAVVEALIHFLIATRPGDSSAPAISAEDYQIRQGRVLYHTVGCVACHEPQAPPNLVQGITPEDPKLEGFDRSLAGAASVPLGDLARKTTVPELAKFLLDPLKTRPSGRMPAMNLTSGEAASIAIYLLRAQAAGLNDPSKKALVGGLKYQYFEFSSGSEPDFDALTPVSTGTTQAFDLAPKRRNERFGFRWSGSIQITREGTYAFFLNSDDGSKLYIDGKLVVDNGGDHAPQERTGQIELAKGRHPVLATFYNNGGGSELRVQWRGPGFERQDVPPDILSHFGQPMVPLDQAEFMVDRDLAAKGRELFASLGCAACHPVPGVAAPGAHAPPLAQLRGPDAGCLADSPPKGAPKFAFSAAQRTALRSALDTKSNDSAEPRIQLQRALARLNCYACHTRDGQGGPTGARLAYFRVAGELDMGDEGRIPPHLSGAGGKLRLDWLREVLVDRARVRPYMATRMPAIGAENVGQLPELFERVDLDPAAKPAPEISPRDAKFGRRLAGVGGLSCISCHTLAPHKSLGISAIDLSVMTKRLRYDWFCRYLIDPPSLRPGTRMPSFWPNGEAVNREILGGAAAAQIQALWAYLESKPETDLPLGLIQGKKEIVATSEPVIYRNFIAGAGTRAIGVGYPEKVNLAFDANQMRLALIWQGPFIDGARHATGRGEGFEPPLGNNIVQWPEGAPLAILPDPNAPWPAARGKDAGFKMGGYQLDQAGHPSFFYFFNGLRIDESFEPVLGEVDAYLRRTLRVRGSPVEHLWFRAATGDIESRNSAFYLNERVRMKFSGAEPVLRGPKGKRELLVPIRFNGADIQEEIVW